MREQSKWTPARVEKLRALHAEGLDPGEIAKRMGGFAHCREGGRSAVLGKAKRLKLSFRRPRKEPKPRRPSSINGGGILINMARKVGKAFGKPAKLPPDPPVPPNCKPVKLVDLTDFYTEPGQCRFPIGDVRGAETLFCGAPKEAVHLPYCTFHADLASGFGPRPEWTPARRAAFFRGRARNAARTAE